MEVLKKKLKKYQLVFRTWDRCRLLNCNTKKNTCDSLPRSKSCPCTTTITASSPDEEKRKKKRQVAPDGCFSVYVGPEKQRFVVKTKFASHPLFKMLLADAELEYGFHSEGPLLLPCDVDLFYKVLAEMDSGEDISSPFGCNGYSPLVLCSPVRRQNSHGSYKILRQSPLIKLNRF